MQYPLPTPRDDLMNELICYNHEEWVEKCNEYYTVLTNIKFIEVGFLKKIFIYQPFGAHVYKAYYQYFYNLNCMDAFAQLHNEQGPARLSEDFNKNILGKQYFLYNKQFTFEEWQEQIQTKLYW